MGKSFTAVGNGVSVRMCTHTCAYPMCALQNVSKVGYAQIYFKRAF